MSNNNHFNNLCVDCNEEHINHNNCGCNHKHYDKCKPKCNMCKSQGKLLFCGETNECLGIKKGAEISSVIMELMDVICDLKIRIKNLESTSEIDDIIE